MAEHAATEHKHPNYILIWGYLLILTIVEVVVAMLHFLPRNMLIFSLVALALWKALLVALYFMHLKFEPKKLIWTILIPIPLAIIMVAYVLQEYGR